MIEQQHNRLVKVVIAQPLGGDEKPTLQPFGHDGTVLEAMGN
jgi:hypothetical protein